MSSSTDNKNTPKAAGQPKATDLEARFFLIILSNLKSPPQVDWHKVAEQAGYMNGPTAAVRFRQIKKRLGIDTGSPAASPAGKVTKRVAKRAPASKATKRTKVSHDGMDSDDDEDSNGSPLAKKSIKVEDEDKKLVIKDEEFDEI
ncbi:hypothetical protein PG991_001488 [Apiospora marii]|uniref:Myb-like DNA-binding domain-containing protein n=1 Tax=Apiospora marii TaxID=335849 RepID=A0ABR1SU10_9PEZI